MCPAFRYLRFLRVLIWIPLANKGILLLLALSPLALPWWIGLLRQPHGVPFTWAFMRWPYTHGGLLAALPKVRLLGKACWRIVRVPQNLCLTPLPGVRSMLLFLASRYGRCSRQRHLHVVIESSPMPGQGLSVSAFNLLSVTPGVRGRFRAVTTSGRLGCFSSITFFSFFFLAVITLMIVFMLLFVFFFVLIMFLLLTVRIK